MFAPNGAGANGLQFMGQMVLVREQVLQVRMLHLTVFGLSGFRQSTSADNELILPIKLEAEFHSLR